MKRKDFEVRTNIKFLVKLGWKGTEIIKALQTVYKMMLRRKLVLTSGLKDFEMVENEDVEDDVEDQLPQKTMKN